MRCLHTKVTANGKGNKKLKQKRSIRPDIDEMRLRSQQTARAIESKKQIRSIRPEMDEMRLFVAANIDDAST